MTPYFFHRISLFLQRLSQLYFFSIQSFLSFVSDKLCHYYRTSFGFFGFVDDIPDSNGLFHGLVLPRAQYMFLWFLSWLSFLSGFVAIAYGHFDLCLVPFGVWFTSILYWFHPDYSWRRYFDMAYVHFALGYQLFRAVGAEHMFAYYTLSFGAVSFFIFGLLLYKYSLWGSTLCHGMVHILGNLANIVLYLGFVVPLHTYI
jgi:hypothetical protein